MPLKLFNKGFFIQRFYKVFAQIPNNKEGIIRLPYEHGIPRRYG